MATSDATITRAARLHADVLFGMACRLATSAVPDRAAFLASLDEILTDPRQLLLVANAGDGSPIGYLHGLVHPAFYANGRVAWVEEVWVDERNRRAGVARSLMDAFEAWAMVDAGATYVALATRRAASFYQAIGYRESATFVRKDLGPA